MNDRRLTIRSGSAELDEPTGLRHRHEAFSGISERLAHRPRTQADVEERYVAAREAWTAAMRAAQSGKPADLAALAIAQDAYETALAEKQRWDSSPRVAIPIEPDRPNGIDAIVGQELSWRRVHELDQEHQQTQSRPKGLRGLVRRLRGR
jgi:hypothetical protein